MSRKFKDLTGKIIGKWQIIRHLTERTRGKGTKAYFLCKCLGCEKEYEVCGTNLSFGQSRQCWRCAMAERKKDTCSKGHMISVWGRTKARTCRGCQKDSLLRYKYGISLADFIQLYEYQNGKCCVCKRDLGSYLPDQEGIPHNCRIEIDHDHKKKGRESVRGLLCGGKYAGCNRKLGLIDRADWLESALNYIKEPPAQKVLVPKIPQISQKV